MTNHFEHILEDAIVDWVEQGYESGMLQDLLPISGNKLYFSSRVLDTIEYPFEKAMRGGELRSDIAPEQLLEWICRIVLTFIQFPKDENQLRGYIRTFVLPALKPQA